MIRHLMANVVRVEYVFPKRADTYLVFDSGLSKFDLMGSALGTIYECRSFMLIGRFLKRLSCLLRSMKL